MAENTALSPPLDLPADADEALDEPASILARKGLYLALLAAWIATLGSLFFSEVMGFLPCPLCWYQRICMYPLAVILPIGLLRRDRGVSTYVLPLALIGISISSYHLLIERGFIQESNACKVGVSCAVRYINWFGFITIPLLAFIGFAIILLSTSAVWREAPSAAPPAPEPAPRPWAPVLGIIVSVCLIFAALTWWYRASLPAHDTEGMAAPTAVVAISSAGFPIQFSPTLHIFPPLPRISPPLPRKAAPHV